MKLQEGLYCFVLLVFTPVIGSYRNDFNPSNEDILPGDYANLSTNEEDTDVPKKVDPKGSWLTFVRHSDRTNNKRNTKNKSKKKRKYLQGPPGPPGPMGPTGPMGPRGPPGALVTKDIILEEFRELVKVAAERRAQELIASKCPGCSNIRNASNSIPPNIGNLLLVPRISAAFNMRLRNNIVIARRTFMELKHFHKPFEGGSFQRGEVFNARDGRFSAPTDDGCGMNYCVSEGMCNKHRTRPVCEWANRCYTCASSINPFTRGCQSVSIEYISGLESNSKTFTINSSGLLELKSGQYASVYVDNGSRADVVVQSSSDFAGILVGK